MKPKKKTKEYKPKAKSAHGLGQGTAKIAKRKRNVAATKKRKQRQQRTRENRDILSDTETRSNAAEPEPKETGLFSDLDPFQFLPWGHVIWQRVLPYLGVVDKFKLRAVNRHCMAVVQEDFDKALAIIPPWTPRMSRTAWHIFTSGNFCATEFRAPHFRFYHREFEDAFCKSKNNETANLPFSFFDSDHFCRIADMNTIFNKHLPLKSLDLSSNGIVPSYQFLKTVTEQYPDLQELILRAIYPGALNSGLRVLCRYKMTRLCKLDLSSSRHDIKLATLQKLVQTQKSLRFLSLDAARFLFLDGARCSHPGFDGVTHEMGSVEELADIWLTSGLHRLTLTRVHGLRDKRLCSNRQGWGFDTLIDAEFVKRQAADGRTTLEFIYSYCFPLAVPNNQPERYIPEEELRAKGVAIFYMECTYDTHLNWFL
ncbi:hypothetical protein V1264_006211 [Littorina saxatilis]|uniref:F-box domain-containing protein n=1 Tax=Littorina saxatilis TaxID=31220 RepID=A0AAN9G407_9CAEN